MAQAGTLQFAGKNALITGIGGQDGSYLAELLLAEGYAVTGTLRPGREPGPYVPAGVELREADLLDPRSLRDVVRDVAPTELYHLAAPTFVPDSWNDPTSTMQAIAAYEQEMFNRMRHMTDDTMRNTDMFYAPDAADQVVQMFQRFAGSSSVESSNANTAEHELYAANT